MKKNLFAIIGKPLSHSLSPLLHNFWFKKYNVLGSYSFLEIQPDKIEGIIKKIRKGELKGVNVTVPYKQAVLPFLDLVVDDAKETLSINTISLNDEGKIVGNNTDVYGLEQGFINRLNNQNLSKSKVLILGAGGVVPSVIYALSKKGAKQIFISNRTIKKAENIKKKFPFVEIVAWDKIETNAEKADILINATSLGLKGGNNFTQEFKTTKSNLIYYDIVYNPEETPITKKFKKRNIQTYNGLEMFIYQGQKSFSIWNKINPAVNEELKKTIMAKL
jgi:shikimate dehydrogenase